MHRFGVHCLNLSSEGINLKIKISGVLLSCLVLSNSALAADGLLGVQGMEIGAGKIYSDLTIKTVHDDNLTSSAFDEQESFGLLVAPHLAYELKNNKNRYFMDFLLTSMTYEGSGVDDYVDQDYQLGYEYTPTKRIYAGIRGEYLKSHDARGSGQAEGLGTLQTTPDKWHHYLVEGNGAYGGKNAKGRAELDLGYIDKEYDNHRFRTFVRDREDTFANARLYYRIMPKTSLLLEGRFTNYNYDQDAGGVPSLDSNTGRVLVGVTWRSTYKTTGTATIGYIEKNFDSSRRKDGDEFTWEVGVTWKPKTFSTINLYSSRDFDETNGAGNFIQHDTIGADWTHQWHKVSPRLSSLVDFTYSEDSFDQAITGREDDLYSIGVAVNYKMRRWLEISGSYRYDERDSTIDLFDYDRNIFELTANIAL